MGTVQLETLQAWLPVPEVTCDEPRNTRNLSASLHERKAMPYSAQAAEHRREFVRFGVVEKKIKEAEFLS